MPAVDRSKFAIAWFDALRKKLRLNKKGFQPKD